MYLVLRKDLRDKKKEVMPLPVSSTRTQHVFYLLFVAWHPPYCCCYLAVSFVQFDKKPYTSWPCLGSCLVFLTAIPLNWEALFKHNGYCTFESGLSLVLICCALTVYTTTLNIFFLHFGQQYINGSVAKKNCQYHKSIFKQ